MSTASTTSPASAQDGTETLAQACHRLRISLSNLVLRSYNRFEYVATATLERAGSHFPLAHVAGTNDRWFTDLKSQGVLSQFSGPYDAAASVLAEAGKMLNVSTAPPTTTDPAGSWSSRTVGDYLFPSCEGAVSADLRTRLYTVRSRYFDRFAQFVGDADNLNRLLLAMARRR